jgi:ribosomal-protein-alanine N-acetyltransferase
MEVAPIRTVRLELSSFSPEVMRAAIAGDGAAVEAAFGATVEGTLDEDLRGFFEVRLADLEADPSIQQWLGRAIILDEGPGRRRVIGSVGFHGPPDAAGRAEVGYQIEPAFRRRGLATEAVRAILDWAAAEHGIRRFRASIAPDNAASVALVAGLGFRRVGTRWDDVDGEELAFERDDWGDAAPG